jgi:hypothetical protein
MPDEGHVGALGASGRPTCWCFREPCATDGLWADPTGSTNESGANRWEKGLAGCGNAAFGEA